MQFLFLKREAVAFADLTRKEHGKTIPIQGSTTSQDDLQRAVDFISKDVGYIDLLVNNAGRTTFDSSPDARPKPTAESSIGEIRDYYFNPRPSGVWIDTLETNVAAVFTTSMAFLELLDQGDRSQRHSPCNHRATDQRAPARYTEGQEQASEPSPPCWQYWRAESIRRLVHLQRFEGR